MKFDKLSLFADGLTVPASANTTTYSKVIDFRKCNLIDGCLKVFGTVVGAVNSSASGQVTTKLCVSADGKDWTDLTSFSQDGSILAAAFLPIKGKKRFARLEFVVGATALSADIKVKAGLVDQFEVTDLPATQGYCATVGSGLEDLTVRGDAMETGLVLAETAKTIAASGNADITITKGAVTKAIAPTHYTVTISDSKINIAVGASATTGNVICVDGLGNKTTVAVTVGS